MAASAALPISTVLKRGQGLLTAFLLWLRVLRGAFASRRERGQTCTLRACHLPDVQTRPHCELLSGIVNMVGIDYLAQGSPAGDVSTVPSAAGMPKAGVPFVFQLIFCARVVRLMSHAPLIVSFA